MWLTYGTAGDYLVVKWIGLCLRKVFVILRVCCIQNSIISFLSINVDVTLCLFANDVFRIAAEFRFCLSIKVSTNDYSFSVFECFDYWSQIFIEGTTCFMFLLRCVEGRCIFTYNIGYSAIIWFNFHQAYSLLDFWLLSLILRVSQFLRLVCLYDQRIIYVVFLQMRTVSHAFHVLACLFLKSSYPLVGDDKSRLYYSLVLLCSEALGCWRLRTFCIHFCILYFLFVCSAFLTERFN